MEQPVQVRSFSTGIRQVNLAFILSDTRLMMDGELPMPEAAFSMPLQTTCILIMLVYRV
jgi:hypothetical protein